MQQGYFGATVALEGVGPASVVHVMAHSCEDHGETLQRRQQIFQILPGGQPVGPVHDSQAMLKVMERVLPFVILVHQSSHEE